MTQVAPNTGLAEPVHGAQAVFRAVLQAMSRPGDVVDLSVSPDAPAPLNAAAAAVCLSLLDFETPLWVGGEGDLSLAQGYLAFHTGAPRVTDSAQADFALVTDGAALPPLDWFRTGTDELPEASTTVIVQVLDIVAAERGAAAWTLTGPGIECATGLTVTGVRDDLPADLAHNAGLFPRGVDLIFCAGARLAALPRTTRVEA